MGILVRGVDPGVISEMRDGVVLPICDRQVFSLGILVYLFLRGAFGCDRRLRRLDLGLN